MRDHVVRADAAEDKTAARAKDLGEAIKAHEAEKAKADRSRADDDKETASGGDGALQQVLAALTGIASRLDALEKPAAKDKADEPPKADKKADAADDEDEDDRDGRKRDAKLATAQARADAVAQAHGRRAPAPLVAETVLAYRRRLLREFQRDSKDFAEVDINTVSGPAFDAIESRIYSDAKAAAANPFVAPNTLVERITFDNAGRRISQFYGDPRSWMQDFMAPRMLVTKINTKGD